MSIENPLFDKKRFAQILKKINNQFPNQRDFAEAIGVNRGYLSQYMNCKLENPPTIKILDKIAKNSNELISYDELMEVCGYKELIKEYNLLKEGDLKYLDLLFEGKQFDDEKDKIIELENIKNGLQQYVENCYEQIDYLQQDDLYRIISADNIQNYRNDIRVTKEKINGLQTMIDKLKKKRNIKKN